MKEVENYFQSKKEPIQSCMLALRSIILDFDNEITEEWKWRIPFYCYKKKIFCYLSHRKKADEIYIGFVRGKQIDHPSISLGSRTHIKVMHFNYNEDIDINTLTEVLNAAKLLYD